MPASMLAANRIIIALLTLPVFPYIRFLMLTEEKNTGLNNMSE